MECKLVVKVDRDKYGMPKLSEGTYRFSVQIKKEDVVMMEVRGFKATKNFSAMSLPSAQIGRGFWYIIATADSAMQQYLLKEVRAIVTDDGSVAVYP